VTRRQRCFSGWDCSSLKSRRASSTSTRASTSWGCTFSATSSGAPPSASCPPTRPEPPWRRLRPKCVTRRADRQTRTWPPCCTDSTLCCEMDNRPPSRGSGHNLRLPLRLHLAAGVVLAMPHGLEDEHGSAATAPHPELVARAGRGAPVQADDGSHDALPLSGSGDSLAVGDDDRGHDLAD